MTNAVIDYFGNIDNHHILGMCYDIPYKKSDITSENQNHIMPKRFETYNLYHDKLENRIHINRTTIIKQWEDEVEENDIFDADYPIASNWETYYQLNRYTPTKVLKICVRVKTVKPFNRFHVQGNINLNDNEMRIFITRSAFNAFGELEKLFILDLK